ncbi:MAG: lipid biosynthesis B12-binding/radical SAM protein [Thermodesulfobacteriota bacterium]
MKILLISANTATEPYPVYPLGLDYVAGALPDGHDVRITDLHTHDNKRLAETIRRFSPDIVGISLRNVDTTDSTRPLGFMESYRSLVDTVRAHSNAVVILGGSGLTIFPDEMMKALGADYGIMGEGERITRLIDALENRRDVSGIPGVVTRDTRSPMPAPWEEGIVRKFSRESDYLAYYLKNGGMLNLQTKRGCHFNCIYCTYPHIEGRKLRLVEPAAVAETAKGLEAAGAKYLYMTDAVFNSDSAHNIAVARALKKAGVSVPWGAFFAPLDPPPDYYRILADSGLTHVEFGTESLSDRVLRSYQKPFKAGHVMAAHRAAVDAGLFVAHYLLLGGPGENGESLDKTLQNMDKLDRAVMIVFCGIRIYPNTPLFEIAVREGQISEDDSLLEPVFYRSAGIAPEEIAGRVSELAKSRSNWLIGSGNPDTAKGIMRLYRLGLTGPLWERLICGRNKRSHSPVRIG